MNFFYLEGGGWGGGGLEEVNILYKESKSYLFFTGGAGTRASEFFLQRIQI